MNDIYSIYKKLSYAPSDINEHLPTLYKYAKQCDHITEMGVRWVVSTWAFLAAQPKKMISYDILNPSQWGVQIEDVYSMAKDEDLDYTFVQANVLDIEIEETDLLFIDTLHNYAQLKEELHIHANKVRKYIIFHDTVTYATTDESSNTTGLTGLLPAITEFLRTNSNWYLREQFINNNGLMVIARIQ